MTSPATFEERRLSRGRTRLFLRTARLDAPVRAEVLLTHGLGEHSGRYTHVSAALAARGLRLWAYDLRGHGRSDGPRGDALYEDLLEDLALVHAEVAQTGRPVFFMGHSMGAQVSLRFLLDRPVECRGAVIASPWLRLSFVPPRWRMALAALAARLYPWLTQSTSSIAAHLSRDLAHLAALPDPELVHHRVSARLFLALQREGRRVLDRAGEFKRPVLLLHGSNDAVTSCAATQEFYERAGSTDKRFVLYPDFMHETHNDLGRERVLEDAATWIAARVDETCSA
ncbi:MAG TPA: alpha/beta hydrolase [Chthoniobacteraceae bacterium]|jgi:alpha-beta hydrolase superfamily lysophospholipase|nr:alpha/beta hydrolase [Chthoniobacteraceae bacterium]